MAVLTSSGVSASGSYPSFSILSASSLAFFSASSKSMASLATTFFAPSLVFLAPRIFFFAPPAVGPFLMAAERGAAASPSVPSRGDLARAPPFAPAARKGDAVRLTTGGVAVREGGLLGRLIAGLSQEAKKSSPSPAGVEEPSVPAAAEASATTTTSSGYLEAHVRILPRHDQKVHVLASVGSSALLQFLLVFDGRIASVLDFRVLVV